MDSQAQKYFSAIEVHDEASELSPTQQELDTIKAFISLDLPVEQAATSLTRRIFHSTELYQMKNRRSKLWNFINGTAINLPSAQPLIVELLRTIRILDCRENSLISTSDRVFFTDRWATLEGWGILLCDEINSYEMHHLGESDMGDAMIEYASKWPQVVSYVAHLTATANPTLADSSFILRSATCVIRALDIEGSVGDPRYGADIKAAAQFFIYCPRQLLQRCAAGSEVEGIDERYFEGKVIWKGGKLLDLSMARWNHWELRWQAIAETQGLSEEIKTLAAKSLEAMKAILSEILTPKWESK